jgi:5'-nucleotidase / UDP-sugar diphosphatase
MNSNTFRRTLLSSSAAAVVGLILSACGGSDGPTQPSFKAIELNIAHINDHHSNLDAIPAFQLKLDGIDTQVDIGGFARQTALFKSLASTPNLLKLHAGDAITGSLYYTFFKGAADAQMMNTICFDAFTLGNHEFDDGDAVTASFLDELAKGTCATPTQTLSANVVPQLGTPLAPSASKTYLKPYTVKTIEGVPVGIIGLATGAKTSNSSRPLAATQFLDEATSTQKAIDELKAKGIRHIVLLSHFGFDNDKALAAKLTDLDVIIDGDSHTLLGDFTAQGLTSGGSYPTLVKNKDGANVCIGQAWEYTKAFGLMNVKFNTAGAVSQCGGQASLVLGDNFKRQVVGTDGKTTWQAMADADKTALMAKLATQPAVKVVTPDASAVQVLSSFSSKVAEAKTQVIGSSADDLCLVRVPGDTKDNRSGGIAACTTANTLARGSDISQVVAEAFLYQAKRSDFALQNGGGVRISVAAGSLSMNTAFTVLPFTNVIVELDITGAQVVAALEDAISNVVDNGSTGPYPYAAGLRWDVDMSKTKGQRLSNVQVRSKTNGTWSAIELGKTYILATNDFIASGQDGYTTLGEVYKAGKYVNTYLLYTQSFVDYVKTKGSISRPARSDYSNQKVITKAGVILPID